MKKTILLLITIAFLSSCESRSKNTNIQIYCWSGKVRNVKITESSNDFYVYYECHRIESDLKNYALQSIRYKKFKKIK